MFKFFKPRDKSSAVEQKLAMQRELKRRHSTTARAESALRANIANKLKNYNAEEDTTISNFTLAEDEVERNLARKKQVRKPSRSDNQDVWGQANPRETGRWKKENR